MHLAFQETVLSHLNSLSVHRLRVKKVKHEVKKSFAMSVHETYAKSVNEITRG